MKKSFIKFLFFIIVISSSFVLTILWINDLNIKIDPELLEVLIENSNSISNENKILNTVVYTLTNASITPSNIISSKYKTSLKEDVNEPVLSVDTKSEDDMVVKEDKTLPSFYIYNTHQTEKYNLQIAGGNLNYSVMDASNFLKDELLKYGIYSVVEEKNVMDVLNSKGWKYAQSYLVSRSFLEKAKKDYPSLNYFIDLHRDSVSKSVSTVNIDGKNYARVLFVLGLVNKNYEKNKKNIQWLNDYLNTNYKGLSRGILERSGPGVNGLYNQDFSENCVLIEVGGEENTTDEVVNTLEVIGKMLYLFSLE